MRSYPLPDGSHWVERYVADRLAARRETTVAAYTLILRQFVRWVAERPGHQQSFHPTYLTQTAVETYLTTHLAASSISHRSRVKSVISGFCQWLIEEGSLFARNPTQGVKLPTQQLLAPRELSDDQRYVLKELVERDDLRGQALFALGYWAGCRVSDVAHLALTHTHVGAKVGWLHVGYKGDKYRDIDLINQARKPLFAYLHQGPRKERCPFVFTSQRARRVVGSADDPWRLTEEGVHAWWRALKAKATHVQWDLIAPLTYHDLRHDFAHRARKAGWSLEEIAVYLGHVTQKGTPAITTTARYTQPSREGLSEKLTQISG